MGYCRRYFVAASLYAFKKGERMKEIIFRGKRTDNGWWEYGIPLISGMGVANMLSLKMKTAKNTGWNHVSWR